MSNTALKKLVVAHLRGSVESFELPFEKGRNLTVIYGENGTGKSTICDALELLSKGKISSLDNRGLGKTNKYWPTLSKTSTDISVVLETASGSCRATFVKNDVVVHPAEARPRVEVLRRGQILGLVEALPSERYTTISRFIDVSGVEKSETALRKLISDLNNNREIAVARILENIGAIEQFWAADGTPGTSAIVWAKAEVAREIQADDPELAALQALQQAYTRLSSYPARLAESAQVLQRARAAAEDAQQAATSYLQSVAQDAGEVMAVLQAARDYLGKHAGPSVCPLCESAAAVQGLAQRIEQRLQAFATLSTIQGTQRSAAEAQQQAEQKARLLAEEAQQDALAFNAIRGGFAWSPELVLPSLPAPDAVARLELWLTATAELPDMWRQAATARQDRRQFLTTLRGAVQTFEENVQGQDELSALLPNLQHALEIVEETRKTFTDTLLRAIASDVGRMYEAVHPGEGLNQIKLALDAGRRASLEIGTTFGGKADLPPQAYFSQSHLDTLGLCVFLALAALDEPSTTILVLDDVLASVDEPHVDRLIRMLYDEAARFRHCIITTHYGPWRHKLRWGWLRNDQCQFVELSRWSRTAGISVIRSVPEVERLRALLAESPPDPQLVCAKAGVILEAALDFLTQLYECSVPRRAEPRYTLGELLPAVKGKLRKTLKVEVQNGNDAAGAPSYATVQLEPILNELDRIAQTRNVVGCHFNAISFDLLDSDALVFGHCVLALIEALADPAAGWPRNSKSGMYWANAGETRRLHPLRQPS